MKKVGLMTCFLDNYGACLQAYALSRQIESQGHKCEIIKYTEPTGYYKEGLVNRLKESGVYNALRCLTSKSYRNGYKFGKARRGQFKKFRKEHLTFTKKEYPDYASLLNEDFDHDCFVCGSDQIWNPTFYGGNNPAYFLDFVNNGAIKIAYAPSIGISEIPKEYQEDFSRLVNRLDHVSVREQRGVELVREIAKRDAVHVLDPTLLLVPGEWEKLVSKTPLVKRPYIFCYLFGNREGYTRVIEDIRNKTGLDVVIVPFSDRDLQKDYIKIYNAGPCEFLNLIKNAEYVITDSFHATVFSVMFRKAFYTLYRFNDGEKVSMNSRINSILNILGLTDRILNDNELEGFKPNQNIDYDAVHEILQQSREESINYLSTALEL